MFAAAGAINFTDLMNRLERGQIQWPEVIREVQKAIQQQSIDTYQLPSLAKSWNARTDAVTSPHQINIPGYGIVKDRREGAPQKTQETAKETAKGEESKKAEEKAKEEMRLKDAKLVEEKDTRYKNFFGDRTARPGALDRQAATERVDRMLSSFFQKVIERFEDGKTFARENPEGKQSFLEKTLAQWREFFGAFSNRTALKKVSLSEIRDFLFRGLYPKGDRGIVVSDMRLLSGRMEKFIRFSILAGALAKFKVLMPGDQFGKGMLEGLSGEELMFLALSASQGPEIQASMGPTQGKFLGGRAEAQAAEALGLPVAAHLAQKARTLRDRGGLLKRGMFGDEGGPEELPYQFIPWWHWGNLVRPGRFRWFTAVFYGSLLALALIGIAVLSWRLLQG